MNSPITVDAAGDDAPSPHRLFRIAILFAVFAIGMQKFAAAVWIAPQGWPALHWPLPDLLSWLGGTLNAVPSQGEAQGWKISYLLAPLLFGAAFWRCSVPSGCTRLLPLLAVQLALALAFNSLWLILVAACLPGLLSMRAAMQWLAGQIALFLLLYLTHSYMTRDGLHLGCSLLGNSQPMLNGEQRFSAQAMEVIRIAVYQLIAFGVGYLGRIEEAGRRTLALLHAETQATQHLLGDNVRMAERARIARDLHDAIGHQLTAINLHLELAARQTPAPAPSALSAARALAQGLLAEVRAIVSVERQLLVPEMEDNK